MYTNLYNKFMTTKCSRNRKAILREIFRMWFNRTDDNTWVDDDVYSMYDNYATSLKTPCNIKIRNIMVTNIKALPTDMVGRLLKSIEIKIMKNK